MDHSRDIRVRSGHNDSGGDRARQGKGDSERGRRSSRSPEHDADNDNVSKRSHRKSRHRSRHRRRGNDSRSSSRSISRSHRRNRDDSASDSSREARRHRRKSRHHHRSRSQSRSPNHSRRHHGMQSSKETQGNSHLGDASSSNAKDVLRATAASTHAGAELLRDGGPRPKKVRKDRSGELIASMFGYTADNNPFGDPNLTDTFVWRKKVERDVVDGKRVAPPTKAQLRDEREALMVEVERARARRAAREAELEEMERLKAEEARLRDSAQYADWEGKEGEFHARQARHRSLIRTRDGRARAVDIIAKNLLLADAVERGEAEGDGAVAGGSLATEVELREPSAILASLTPEELRSLLDDVASFEELEASSGAGGTRGPNAVFWAALRIAATDTLTRASQEGGSASEALAEGGAAFTNVTTAVTPSAVAAIQGVANDVAAQFEGQDEAELDVFERSVRDTIDTALTARRTDEAHGRGAHGGRFGARHGGGTAGVHGGAIDVEYWEGVLSAITVARSHARLRRMHEEQLLRRLAQLEKTKAALAAARSSSNVDANGATMQQQPVAQPDESGWEADDTPLNRSSAATHHTSAPRSGNISHTLAPADTVTDATVPVAFASVANAQDGSSAAPAVAQVDEARNGTQAPASASDDRRRLLESRIAALRERGVLPPDAAIVTGVAAASATQFGGADGGDEAVALDAAGRPLPSGATEADMGADMEVSIPGAAAAAQKAAAVAADVDGVTIPTASTSDIASDAAYLLGDKYRPRKPRYFNRVKTGYDWNKYNSSHYDFDNPPPKTVQGYKFNVFYPDLLDRTQTPRFFLEPADSDEFAIIRFHAGPPYEDVAFKIVNREWEQAKKHGFRCSFDRGILQLWFNFKRARYRR